MFFFRLHNLQREQENKRKKSAERQRQRRGGRVFRCVSDSTGHLTLAPSRLFERTPMSPSDSLDEIALQIPRYSFSNKKKTISFTGTAVVPKAINLFEIYQPM